MRDADGRILAGARAPEGGFADATRVLAGLPAEAAAPAFGRGAHHTTLAIVATNALLDGTQRAGLARAATAALFRRITPTGTVFDGDVVFALSPFEGELVRPPVQIEALAVRALERAIERAVRLARGRDGIPGLADDAGDPRGAGAADAARGR